MLMDGDAIEFGLENSPKIVFRRRPAEHYVENMLTRLGSLPAIETAAGDSGLSKLNLLLEATSLLHSALPLESVLSTMLDHAMSVTNAERGLLLEADDEGVLTVRLARGSGGTALPAESIAPSQTALRQAVSKRAAAITDDLNLDDLNLKSAQSVVIQGLRAVVAIPLYAVAHANADGSETAAGRLLGALYLDSRRTTAFSNVDRQILDALSAQAASILDNARLVEKEREQRRLEQELAIAREIQQGLVPQGLREFPYLEVKGIHLACHGVGGDYYDVFPLSDESTAFLVADVTGKGLGAALLTTMLQGALSGMKLGVRSRESLQPREPLPVRACVGGALRDHVFRQDRCGGNARVPVWRASVAAADSRRQGERTVHRRNASRWAGRRSDIRGDPGPVATQRRAGAVLRRHCGSRKHAERTVRLRAAQRSDDAMCTGLD